MWRRFDQTSTESWAMKRRVLQGVWFGVTGVYWVICFVLTHLYVPAGLPGGEHDKIRHYVGFGGLGGALWICAWSWRWPVVRSAAVVMGVLMVYAALDEITQPAVGRTCDFFDWVADMGGAATAVACLSVGQLVLARRTQAAAQYARAGRLE
jgi:VanZ family protein